MLRHAHVLELLLFCFCSLLLASCSSPNGKVDNQSDHAVTIVAGDAHERAAAYAERLRLGLGSPYRLIEIAARDQRLGAASATVARSLLLQIEHGQLYQISPHALSAAGLHPTSAIAQLELIQRAVASAQDPLTGELAINLAYELAASQNIVTPHVATRALRIAALTRDRALAIEDAKRLRAAARKAQVAPESLVPTWREQRLFLVERPTLAPLDASSQAEAARLALLLVGGIRAASNPVSSVVRRTVPASTPLLDEVDARTLLTDSAITPQSALVVTLRSLRAAHTESRWQEFFDQATDEERFVAALSVVRQDSVDEHAAAAVALDAAVALRPFAQEPVVPGTLSLPELRTRFGVSVRFKRVSEAQQQQAIAMLATALTDLRSVIRTLDLRGLTFEIAPMDPSAPHLAFHDPRKRVVRLDPVTMAGTLAHELAHDLDWQLSARKYRTRANYATDYATRNRRALAYAVQSLSADAAEMGQQSDQSAQRPAEMFARRFEWYVASALALRGRSSGYLSSVQSDWISGYGSAVRPGATPAAARSFAALVAEATGMDRSDLAEVQRTVVESSWQCSSTWQLRAFSMASSLPSRCTSSASRWLRG